MALRRNIYTLSDGSSRYEIEYVVQAYVIKIALFWF